MEESTSEFVSSCGVTEDGWDARQWDTREDCEVRHILDRIADKWSLLAVALLEGRSMRFTELSRAIDGISQRMLTHTLRQLERDGLVHRTVHATVPPRVDYELTPLGGSLHETIRALVGWTEEHQREIAAARAAYDVRIEADQQAASSAAEARNAVARNAVPRQALRHHAVAGAAGRARRPS
jgi:DNA-binding HxlR family transcriptional regulator